MKKFMVAYMSKSTAEERMNDTSPEAKKGMDEWMKWFQEAGDMLVDTGSPLGVSEHVGKGEHPKPEVHVTGYSIIQAEDMDTAKKLLANHPHTMMPDSCIEVSEILPKPGM